MKKSSLKAIQRLHLRDMRASASGDFRALRALVDYAEYRRGLGR